MYGDITISEVEYTIIYFDVQMMASNTSTYALYLMDSGISSFNNFGGTSLPSLQSDTLPSLPTTQTTKTISSSMEYPHWTVRVEPKSPCLPTPLYTITRITASSYSMLRPGSSATSPLPLTATFSISLYSAPYQVRTVMPPVRPVLLHTSSSMVSAAIASTPV